MINQRPPARRPGMGGVTSDSSVACGEGRGCGCRAMTGRVDPEAHSNLVLTVGHSTRTFKEFLSLLRAQGVRRLVDVRRFPPLLASPALRRGGALRAALSRGCDTLLAPAGPGGT